MQPLLLHQAVVTLILIILQSFVHFKAFLSHTQLWTHTNAHVTSYTHICLYHLHCYSQQSCHMTKKWNNPQLGIAMYACTNMNIQVTTCKLTKNKEINDYISFHSQILDNSKLYKLNWYHLTFYDSSNFTCGFCLGCKSPHISNVMICLCSKLLWKPVMCNFLYQNQISFHV